MAKNKRLECLKMGENKDGQKLKIKMFKNG